MSDSGTASGGGIGFTGMLTILFVGLKLGGIIDWSWLWVLSPLWISGLAVALVLAVMFAVAVIGWKHR